MKELLVIIPKLPGVRVYEFSGGRTASQLLADFCQAQGHYLEIAALNDALFDELRGIPAKVRRLEESKERYNQRSMSFDTIFVNYDIARLQNLEEFFRKNYRMMKNAADIIIKTDKERLSSLEDLLQELNFVAINPIEYSLGYALTAKKMHGWAKV